MGFSWRIVSLVASVPVWMVTELLRNTLSNVCANPYRSLKSTYWNSCSAAQLVLLYSTTS